MKSRFIPALIPLFLGMLWIARLSAQEALPPPEIPAQQLGDPASSVSGKPAQAETTEGEKIPVSEASPANEKNKQEPETDTPTEAPEYVPPVSSPTAEEIVASEPDLAGVAEMWILVNASQTSEDYQSFLKAFPHSSLAAAARSKLKLLGYSGTLLLAPVTSRKTYNDADGDKQLWERIKNSVTLQEYEELLRTMQTAFPNSSFSKVAEYLRERLRITNLRLAEDWAMARAKKNRDYQEFQKAIEREVTRRADQEVALLEETRRQAEVLRDQEMKKRESLRPVAQRLEDFRQMLAIQAEASSLEIGQLLPNVQGSGTSFNWSTSGIAYGMVYQRHYGEVKYLQGTGEIGKIFIAKDQQVKSVDDLRVRIAGFYYTPVFRPGWVYGFGLEQWLFTFVTETREYQVPWMTPLADAGYQIGGKLSAWSMLIKIQIGSSLLPIGHVSLGYAF